MPECLEMVSSPTCVKVKRNDIVLMSITMSRDDREREREEEKEWVRQAEELGDEIENITAKQ